MNKTNRTECNSAILSDKYADFFVQHGANLEQIRQEFGVVCEQVINYKYSIIHLPISSTNDFITYNYNNSMFPKLYGLMVSNNIEDIGVARLRRLNYLNLLGQGTIIGFVDTGIDYTMDVFKNADNTTRITHIWDQTIQNGSIPTGFNYGTEYLSAKINEALQSEKPLDIVPSTDTDGHGSFMASIAAGNIAADQDFTGVAPLADIMMVKLKSAKENLRNYYFIREGAVCYQETDIVMGIKYLLEKSFEVGKPIVICLGVGTNLGGHEGTGILDEYLGYVENLSGICVIVPTGNEANYSGHYRGDEELMGDYDDVELRVGEGERGFAVELWAKAPSVYSIGLLSPSGEIVERIPARVNNSQIIRFIFESTIVYVDFRFLEIRTGDELIFLRFFMPTAGIWRIRVYKEITFNNHYDLWLPIKEFIGQETYFIKPNPDVTITDPGNTSTSITVAAYDHVTHSIYLNSGRGPTRTGRIKPDIAAPGVNVFGALPNNSFGVRSGTSIAAAHTAGAAALLLEWGIVNGNRPTMETREIKTLFIKGATRTNIKYPNNEWGYGALNIYGAFESLRTTL